MDLAPHLFWQLGNGFIVRGSARVAGLAGRVDTTSTAVGILPSHFECFEDWDNPTALCPSPCPLLN